MACYFWKKHFFNTKVAKKTIGQTDADAIIYSEYLKTRTLVNNLIMIKTTVIPQNNTYHLAIPNDYIGKKIEILFYALDEVAEQNTPPKKMKLSDKYKGIISKEQGQDLNDHIKQMRSEWNNI